MAGNRQFPTVVSFGPFEADLHTQELRKQGVRLRLPGQSFHVLKMLLDRPGELVGREELHKALWPSDTFVDFEHGVNAAVNRLREVLGDSADSPKHIETLPRRGYRFIGTVNLPPPEAGRANAPGCLNCLSPDRCQRCMHAPEMHRKCTGMHRAGSNPLHCQAR